MVKGGTWNTRGWGGKYARVDPFLKVECLLAMIDARDWAFCLFTDVKSSVNGVREYKTRKNAYTVIIQGKVAMALREDWASKWRQGGARPHFPGQARSGSTRCMAIEVAGAGHRRGWFLVAVYAPVSGNKTTAMRERLYKDLSALLRKKTCKLRLVIGGDFNAEFGAQKDEEWESVMGGEGTKRRTKTSIEKSQASTVDGFWTGGPDPTFAASRTCAF